MTTTTHITASRRAGLWRKIRKFMSLFWFWSNIRPFHYASCMAQLIFPHISTIDSKLHSSGCRNETSSDTISILCFPIIFSLFSISVVAVMIQSSSPRITICHVNPIFSSILSPHLSTGPTHNTVTHSNFPVLLWKPLDFFFFSTPTFFSFLPSHSFFS